MSLVYQVRTLHQIEVTSRCNLACVYCLQPILQRPKQDMTPETWERALSWVRYFIERGTQGDELVLYGTGEPLLHPRFAAMLADARAVLGQHREIIFTTNGLLVDERLIAALDQVRPARVWVSLHRPEKAQRAVQLLKAAGLLAGFSTEAATAPMNWAGQVAWPVDVAAPEGHNLACRHFVEGWAYVDSAGRIGSCCNLDDQADGVVGHVAETPHPIAVGPYALCAACWHTQPAPHQVKTRIVQRGA